MKSLVLLMLLAGGAATQIHHEHWYWHLPDMALSGCGAWPLAWKFDRRRP